MPASRSIFWRADGIRSRAAGRGFTILEILITLALIGLLAGVLISGSVRLLADTPEAPYDVFAEALAEARKEAVERNAEVTLAYDSRERVFFATARGREGAVEVGRFPVVYDGNDLRIDFLVAGKGNPLLLGGVLVDTASVSEVTFYPNGTCTAFRVQIQLSLRDQPLVVEIDPWTCAPILSAEGLSS